MIISGGQTGVDRAGLEWGLEHGFTIGGYATKGYRSEDGIIPEPYRSRMWELETSDYPTRTKLNVLRSDVTLIVFPHDLDCSRDPGTCLTMKLCKGRAFFRYPFADDADEAATFARSFDVRFPDPIRFLNIAGPRGSAWPDARIATHDFLDRVLAVRKLRQHYKR